MRRCATRLGAFLVFGLLAAQVHAAEHRFAVLFDTDGNAATGCAVATSKGVASGIDDVWTTVVTTSPASVTVMRIEHQTCVSGSLGSPTVASTAGWPAGVGNGSLGTAAIETFVPRAALPTQGTLQVRVASTNASGGQDATSAFAVTFAATPPPPPPPAPSGGPPAQPIPLSPWLVPPLALLIFGAALWLRRRRPRTDTLMLAMVLVAIAGLAWAASVVLDGNVGDWNGIVADATNAKGSAPVDANIVAVFHQADANNLYLRIDADVVADVVPGNAAPVVAAGSDQTVTLPASASLQGSASDDGLPNPPGALTLAWSTVSGPGTVSFGDASAAATSATFSQSGTYVLRLTANDSASSASDDVAITVEPQGGATLEPTAIEPSVATTVGGSTRFLYEGSNPVQTGVAPGTIEKMRASVVRGRVLARDGSPLPGVTVTIVGHPELGETHSGDDGGFDLAVNGGGPLTLDFAAAGFLPAQRRATVPWQDYVNVPDTVLVALDGQASSIAMNAPAMQVHRGSVSSDADGTRQATVLFPAGTTAQLVMPDGSMQPVTNLTVRATEFTVGPDGKKAMPAMLPPASAYTYAVSFSADEAGAAGATGVLFNQPVIQYVENFLDFPVGTPVPTGVYDMQKSAWLAIPDGQVIGILSVTGGLADVDSDGDGVADNTLAMSNDERTNLATLYAPGQTLWRTPLPHFSYVDNNWGFIPVDATPPTDTGPVDDDPLPDPQTCEGCIIEMENQVLGQRLPIVGTPFTLNYRSDREPGHVLQKTIQLSGAAPLPPKLASIGLTLNVAGRTIERSFAPSQNLSTKFVWDRKDAYGRTVQGGQTLTGSVDYHYPAQYARAALSDGTPSFGKPPGANAVLLEGFRDQTFAASLPFSTTIGEGLTDARAIGLGGWTLSAHHFYDPIARVLHRGDGTRRRAESLSRVVSTTVSGPANGVDGSIIRPDSTTGSIAIASDGSLYFFRLTFGTSGGMTLRRLDPNGTETLVAGAGSDINPPYGDDGPATAASEIRPPIALAPDGSIYVMGANVIRRIGTDGIIRRFAGQYPALGAENPVCAFWALPPDDVPATQTFLCIPKMMTVAPDGSVYILEDVEGDSHHLDWNRIRRVGADGIITTVAGAHSDVCDGALTLCQTDVPALGAPLGFIYDIAFAADGTLYFSAARGIQRIGTDGIVHTMATGFTCPFVPGLLFPTGIAVGPDGSVYAATQCGQIVEVTANGTKAVIAGTAFDSRSSAGTGSIVRTGDGGPAIAAGLGQVPGLALGPDGTLSVLSYGWQLAPDGSRIPGSFAPAIRRIGTFIPGVSTSQFTIASEDGTELYVFDADGRHLRTLNALTGAALFEFAYDASGHLSKVVEKTGGTDNVTTIAHDANGNPTSITGPYGQVTTLGVDANGFLDAITNPAGDTARMTNDSGGLMASYSDPRGSTSAFAYDADGRLLRDTDPAGSVQQLARQVDGDTVTVTRTTGLGRVSTFTTQRLPGNRMTRITVEPDGTRSQTDETIDAGTTHATSAGGTSADTARTPDPRFGMQVPLPGKLAIALPDGTTFEGGLQRTVVLAQVDDPLSLVSLTDTATIDGHTSSSTYTAATGTTVTTSPAGRTLTMTTDALGRPTSTRFSGLPQTSFAYDGRGRLTDITWGSGASARALSLAYGANGFPDTITDSLGRTAHSTYDAAGRVTARTLAGGAVVSFAYDATGNMTSLTPPGRPAYGFAYSSRNELVAITPPAAPGSGATTFSYDADRQLTRIGYADGRAIDLGYDAGGRLASRALSNGGTVTGTASYTYDAAGRVATIATSAGVTTTYQYSGPFAMGTHWSGPVAGDVTRTYDSAFRLSGFAVNGGSPFAYAYDADDEIVAAGSLALTRDPAHGMPVATSLGSVTTAATYDAFGAIGTYEAAAAGGPIFSEAFVRDALGRVVQKTETVAGVSDVYGYQYDTAGQLVDVKKNGATVESYAFDANGNRTSATLAGVTVTATFDDLDRIVQYGAAQYAYDAAGYLASETAGSAATQYRYDRLGNLAGVVLPGGIAIDYVVDGRGRRIGKKVDGTLTSGLLYGDGIRPVAELDGSGALVSLFVYAGGVAPSYMHKGGTDYRFITDPLGSVRLVVDSTTGAIAQRLDYDSYGNVTLDTHPGFQPFGYAGGLYDPDTALVRFGTRDYEARSGRWTATDPAGFLGNDANLYRYARNDPVDLADTSGMGVVGDALVGIAAGIVDTVGHLGMPFPEPPTPTLVINGVEYRQVSTNPVTALAELINYLADDTIVDTDSFSYAAGGICSGFALSGGAAGVERGLTIAGERAATEAAALSAANAERLAASMAKQVDFAAMKEQQALARAAKDAESVARAAARAAARAKAKAKAALGALESEGWKTGGGGSGSPGSAGGW